MLLGGKIEGRARFVQLIGAACGESCAFLLTKTPLWLGLLFSVIQAAETAAAGATLSANIKRFTDLRQVQNVLRLCTVAVLAPAIFVGLVSIPAAILTHGSPWQTWKIVMPSDALGLAIIFPPALYLITGKDSWRRLARRRSAAPILSILLFTAISVAIFAQTSMPFLFLAFPPLLLISFIMGVEGAVFALPLLAITACVGTAHGMGPIWLNRNLSEANRILVLQVFLGTASLKALAVGALLDERRRAGRTANQARIIYETLIDNADDTIILSSLDGEWRFVSPAIKKLTGWSAAEFLAMKPLQTVHVEDRDLARAILASLAGGKSEHTFRYRLMRKDGDFLWAEAAVRGIRISEDTALTGYVATVRDISRQKLMEESWIAERAQMARKNRDLAEQALSDELTGVANRRAFILQLNAELARHGRSEKHIALLMIDVDYFKRFNDRYGHPEGDACLRKLAACLTACTGRVSDLVARVGGEEFAVLLPMTDEMGAMRVADKIHRAVEVLSIEHTDGPIGRVSVSIGIASWPPQHSSEGAHLIQCADRALYESKRLGRNRSSIFREGLQMDDLDSDPSAA